MCQATLFFWYQTNLAKYRDTVHQTIEKAHGQQTPARRWCKTCDVTKIPVPRFQLSMTLDLVTRAVSIVGLGSKKGLRYQLQQLATKYLSECLQYKASSADAHLKTQVAQ